MTVSGEMTVMNLDHDCEPGVCWCRRVAVLATVPSDEQLARVHHELDLLCGDYEIHFAEVAS